MEVPSSGKHSDSRRSMVLHSMFRKPSQCHIAFLLHTIYLGERHRRYYLHRLIQNFHNLCANQDEETYIIIIIVINYIFLPRTEHWTVPLGMRRHVFRGEMERHHHITFKLFYCSLLLNVTYICRMASV
jgi:hypothetical protein